MSFETFWEKISHGLGSLDLFYSKRNCPAAAKSSTINFVENFKQICSYMSGEYSDGGAFLRLDERLRLHEGASARARRLFYLALPPSVFLAAVAQIKERSWNCKGWNRVVVEKPFGRDSQSAEELDRNLKALLHEEETYRMDHFLGKEMVRSILTLRFANVAFMPLFHRQFVKCVRLTFKEDLGTMGRGGYFDSYGIIRDVLQNHLLQLLMLIAMERPASLTDDDVRDEKVKVLKQMNAIKLDEVVVGQYTESSDKKHRGYLDDPTVAADSRTPTFATAVLWVNNDRWQNVPFIMKAGKGLPIRRSEIRVQLESVPGMMFNDLSNNELVIQLQPNEAVYLKIFTKKPGLYNELQETELDLSVLDRFSVARLPDAYERLLLDAIGGDKANFVRSDELRESWRIFSPVLAELDDKKIEPLKYPFLTEGPQEAYSFIRKYYNYNENRNYSWQPPSQTGSRVN
eukprot:GHVT01049751.1.p1 GENE.GHVT01049751.1~~GHVT01049751.1.p1  ORF type:complete len:459 (-),score=94.08 GHVT01049751.1:526-1902(-)